MGPIIQAFANAFKHTIFETYDKISVLRANDDSFGVPNPDSKYDPNCRSDSFPDDTTFEQTISNSFPKSFWMAIAFSDKISLCETVYFTISQSDDRTYRGEFFVCVK